ncbi:Integral membrane protein CcmA involved in cell shape determination [Leptolyngbyaceae cyanobacterium JSC-12]|nr:Integral membrane protein CcmA involved in cell shape determination [Leptolyngbyaceae cyanobacterium JSC-12]
MFHRNKPIPASTYLAPNSEFQGDLHVEGNLRVDGVIHGTVEVRGDMEISSTGLVEGPEVRVRNLIVHGVLKARVVAEGRLTLSRTARLEGDVVANALDIEAGAFYVGYIEAGDAKLLPGFQARPELMASREEL